MDPEADAPSPAAGPAGRSALAAAGYRDVGAAASVRANRGWWDEAAPGYLAEHGEHLGDRDLVWGPEGLREADARLLGDVRGRRVLEVGCGAAQGSRWLADEGAEVVGLDLSAGMIAEGRRADPAVALLQADAARLPLADASVDLAVSAYGALPFTAEPERVHAEVARVLRPGGRWVFSLTHPVRWAFPDDPGEAGLVVTSSYFDTTPYAETGEDGEVLYAEHHRTLGQRVREVVGAGFRLVDLVEPRWPAGRDVVWGGWSPLRGRVLPGTAVFVCDLPS
ncbi:class I SAM-dependent methyltransferase [uncultured Pseudokineococcus sp.]|uniref:class I SAM-dependent methyltransferase n=1 Tax=uncultured Pseudokineococcus sp. TaxID=1642928 RepID=UPI002608647C|nr:class I SAM-dependent methyltransferase [uncultured Pseudokineococcus sp.]